MSEQSKKKTVKVRHCPSCGTISVNPGVGRVHSCPECKGLIGAKGSGEVVNLSAGAGTRAGASKVAPVSGAKVGERSVKEVSGSLESSNQRRKSSSRKPVSRWKGPLFVLGTFFVMVGLVTFFLWNKLEQKEAKLREAVEFIRNNPEGMAKERERRKDSLKKQAAEKDLPSMANTLVSFFRKKETDERWAYIYESSRQAGAMAEHYKRGISIGDGKSADVRLLTWELVEAGNTELGVTVWNTDGGDVAAVFVKTGLGWKLDWRFLERYSEGSWVLFFGDHGKQQEGEFRAYLRLRSIQNAGKWDVSVHRPNDYVGTYDSDPAVSLSVDKASEVGKKLTLLFEEESALGGRSHYRKYDKSNCYRARILLEKVSDDAGEPQIQLKDVLAANWLDDELQQKAQEPEKSEPAVEEGGDE